MGDYKPVKGDRVRVVLEGEVDHLEHDGFALGRSVDSNFIVPGAGHVVSVEKIDPPATVFQPGDVVRTKGSTSPGYALSEKGYVDLSSGRYYEDGRKFGEDVFTSSYYELVPLG